MARGFESKDVEYQQAEAERRRTLDRAPAANERESAARRRTLLLAIARTEADLGAATAPAHRRMLEQALVTLRDRVGRVSPDDAA